MKKKNLILVGVWALPAAALVFVIYLIVQILSLPDYDPREMKKSEEENIPDIYFFYSHGNIREDDLLRLRDYVRENNKKNKK